MFGGAVAAALVTILTLGLFYWPSAPEAAVVESARTDLPGGVMVFCSFEHNLTVVWVFDD